MLTLALEDNTAVVFCMLCCTARLPVQQLWWCCWLALVTARLFRVTAAAAAAAAVLFTVCHVTHFIQIAACLVFTYQI
jgi:hypothetical protein